MQPGEEGGEISGLGEWSGNAAGMVSALLLRLGAHEVRNLDVLFGLPPASGGAGGAAAQGTFPICSSLGATQLFFFFFSPLFPCSIPQQLTALRPSHHTSAVLQQVSWSEDHFAFAGPSYTGS